MVDKAQVAKKAGIAYAAKKILGKVAKLAVIAGIGAAVVKVRKGQED